MGKPGKLLQRSRDIVGWRELVGLPDFNIEQLRAKMESDLTLGRTAPGSRGVPINPGPSFVVGRSHSKPTAMRTVNH